MTQDLTVGKPISRIWQFAVPVLFGLLLQQVYSLVDTAIVGHALGVMALGGVGATGSVNFLVLGFCGGLCTGMAIPLAQAFGAGEYRQLRRYVAGCVWLGLIMSAVLLAVTLPGTRGLLRLMGTPEEQMDYAFNYIFIIFVGIPTTILYNMGACVLRALGDSKSPVWFLAAASAINIVLDLLTVCVLGLGVAGAALATVVSQLGSGLLCVGYLKKHFPILRMEKDDWKLRRPEVMRLLGMGYIKQLKEDLWEGRYSPVWPDGKKHSRNVYGRTREECEEKLAKLILQMKAEIAVLRNGTAAEYPDGVSPKKKQLADYLSQHPGVSNKSYIARETGMDRTTVQKYYDEVRAELAAPANT